MAKRIPKRISQTVLQSLSAGLAPRIGAEEIAVGRKDEIEALLSDLDGIVANGGATFRIIVGHYGSGKTFLLQLLRNYAFKRKFVVADADLSPQKRLTGSKNEGLELYRELLNRMAIDTRPDGNAFAALLEKWIDNIQSQVVVSGISPSSSSFNREVEKRIYASIHEMKSMVHGFDFASVINAYWHGHLHDDDELKDNAIRWLRGEFNTKTEARQALNVRVIIDDSTWYDYIKLLAYFVRQIGYRGLIIFIDEAVNLYKISHRVSRDNNYERLLTILNDTLQGKAEYLGVLFGAAPNMVYDERRGLYGYEALKTRLEESRFARPGLRDMSGPLIQLDRLSDNEIFWLLRRVKEIHAMHHKYESVLNDQHLERFMKLVSNHVGAKTRLTAREVLRAFVSLLNLMQQNSDESFDSIVGEVKFTTEKPFHDPEALTPATEIHDDNGSSPYASFQI